MPAPPTRTPDQRLAALRQANAVRTARAVLKRSLAAGTANICELLASPTPEIATMRVSDLIAATPKRGEDVADAEPCVVKTKRLLLACRISEHKTVGGLSTRQRLELCAALS